MKKQFPALSDTIKLIQANSIKSIAELLPTIQELKMKLKLKRFQHTPSYRELPGHLKKADSGR